MRALFMLSALLLASCGEKGMVSASNESADAAPVEALMVKEEAAPGQADAAAPQIAYRYSRRYRTPTDGIAALQDRHVALCEQAGKGACHVLSQRIAEAATGQDSELMLSVTASKARTLLLGLDKAVEGNGGDVVASGTEAEDLGTRIVDVEARLRAKQALVDRLLVIIRSRTGGIKDGSSASRAEPDAPPGGAIDHHAQLCRACGRAEFLQRNPAADLRRSRYLARRKPGQPGPSRHRQHAVVDRHRLASALVVAPAPDAQGGKRHAATRRNGQLILWGSPCASPSPALTLSPGWPTSSRWPGAPMPRGATMMAGRMARRPPRCCPPPSAAGW
jgi:Domain of unknown function (DUF4349)